MCRREGDADRKNWRFVKHVFRHHNEVANDWAEKWAKGERIRCMTRKTNGCEVLKEVRESWVRSRRRQACGFQILGAIERQEGAVSCL